MSFLCNPLLLKRVKAFAQKRIIMQSLSEGEKYSLVANHPNVAVCVTDFNLKLEWASEAFYNLLGCDKESATGQVLSNLIFEEAKLPQNFIALINRVGLENQASAEIKLPRLKWYFSCPRSQYCDCNSRQRKACGLHYLSNRQFKAKKTTR
jgi:PAS domain-containing protein